MFQTKLVDKIKTHIFIFSNFFFPKIIPFEIIRKNTAVPKRSQMTITHMRFCMLDT